MHEDLRTQVLQEMRRVKAGNANRKGAIPGSMAPRVIEKQQGPLVTFPPYKINEGERINTNVIRFRR